MGKIKKILESELIGGTQSTDVYPVTSTKAVYDENNERLDNIINKKIETDRIANGAVTTDKIADRAVTVEKLDSNAISDYDVSAHNGGAVFESLSALLSSSNLSTLIPTSVRHGGMSIRFIQSSDNKYVQYRLMANEWSTNPYFWERYNDVTTSNQPNSDLDFVDEDRNVLARFDEGHIKTKNFDSKYAPFIKEKPSITPFFIADINGNYIFIIKNNSHIKTKSFDSELLLTSFNSFQQYNRGGTSNQSITGIASDSDLKINSTLNHILKESPNSDVILVSNFYANSLVSRNAKRRAYREELKAFSDYYGLGYIDLSGLGIIRPTTVGTGIYTIDGAHAYTEAGAQKIYSYILGYLVSRYGDLTTLESKTILILGDSSAVEYPGSGNTTWSVMLKSKLGANNVTIKAVAASSWLYNGLNEIDSRNVEWQFDQSLSRTYDIIIITSGGNELSRFNLDYQSTLNYLINQ